MDLMKLIQRHGCHELVHLSYSDVMQSMLLVSVNREIRLDSMVSVAI